MSGNSGRILVCRGLRVSGRCVYRDKDGMCFTDGQTLVPCTATEYVPLAEHERVVRERDEARREVAVLRRAVDIAAETIANEFSGTIGVIAKRLVDDAAAEQQSSPSVRGLGREKG